MRRIRLVLALSERVAAEPAGPSDAALETLSQEAIPWLRQDEATTDGEVAALLARARDVEAQMPASLAARTTWDPPLVVGRLAVGDPSAPLRSGIRGNGDAHHAEGSHAKQ
ncbi:MAG TPA: hypothetical protein VM681_01465 [Candidatus Thermoplasmatota archaeon]|nr:hypothetical protein [Candidatus Thermoplasmatota archaeon]